jgi:hypothetical protein
MKGEGISYLFKGTNHPTAFTVHNTVLTKALEYKEPIFAAAAIKSDVPTVLCE